MRVKIPYYRIKGRMAYWEPKKAMKAEGWGSRRLGPHGPEAMALAMEINAAYKASKAGTKPPPYPTGSLQAAFEDYRRTPEWSKKAPRTREEWDRAWKHMAPLHHMAPASITLMVVSKLREKIAAKISQREAHRTVKVFRALWRVCAALGYTGNAVDPSSGIRNTEPTPRQAVWTEGEAARAAKDAWRAGYHGLAALLAFAWDTGVSPVDARTLTPAQRTPEGFMITRGKTGKVVPVTVGRRAENVMAAYLAKQGIEPHPTTPIFRHRQGRPYSKDTLGDDFRAIRGKDETRTIADFRRSGTVEAVKGGATAVQIGRGLGNDFARSKALQETYSPANFEMHRQVREARRNARK